jgi:hypothetical protein
MNAEETLNEMATLRRQAVERICASPENFKVCEGCDGILARKEGTRGTCPICGAYRFDLDAERVKRNAIQVGARPMGLTVPYVPRFPRQEIP